jgi:hypothetical protein
LVRNITNANNDFLTPTERAFNIRKCLEGTQHIINLCLKNDEETKDLSALKIALDGTATFQEMLRQVSVS